MTRTSPSIAAQLLVAVCLISHVHGLSLSSRPNINVHSMLPRSTGNAFGGAMPYGKGAWATSTALFVANVTTEEASPVTMDTPKANGQKSPPTPRSWSKNEEALSKRTFPRTWVPLASTYELDPDRPTPVQFLDQKFVCYKASSDDQDDTWIVMDDVCPHRLVPLSEGRINRNFTAGETCEPTSTIQCSYHGWEFNSEGACVKIPQATPEIEAAALQSPRSAVATYSTQIHKNVLWFWPWPDTDSLSLLPSYPKGHPEGIMAAIANTKDGSPSNPSTYTRDLPYGWDTLLENLIDPAHIPFAHHGLQGTREDAIPIGMSVPESLGEFEYTNTDDSTSSSSGKSGGAGFFFEWKDRTRGKHRAGTAEFQAPYGIAYDGIYYDNQEEADASWGTHSAKRRSELFGSDSKDSEATKEVTESVEEVRKDPQVFQLGVLCIPTKPGWSRAIIFAFQAKESKQQAKERKAKEKEELKALVAAGKPKPPKKKKSLFMMIFGLIPQWATHLLTNRFLDSDLAFLHYQEQERLRYEGADHGDSKNGSGYYMPAAADRCISKLRQWIPKHTDYFGGPNHVYTLPPPMVDRSQLFDRYLQHTSHCKHCQEGLQFLQTKAKKLAWGGLMGSVVASHFVKSKVMGLMAKFVAVACLGAIRLFSSMEKAFKVGEFKHYQND